MAKDSRWGRGKVFLLVLLCASLFGNATLLVQWWSNNRQWESEMYGIASWRSFPAPLKALVERAPSGASQ